MSLPTLVAAAGTARDKKTDKKNPVDPMEERIREREAKKAAKAAAVALAAGQAKAASEAPTMAKACELYAAYAADRSNVKASTESWTNALIKRVILPAFLGEPTCGR